MENRKLCRLRCRRRDLRANFGEGPYAVHAMAYGLYPFMGDNGNRVLYRDFGYVEGWRKLALLVPEKPDERFLRENGIRAETRDLPAGWLDWDRYVFDVEINADKNGKPVVSRGHSDRGRREPILDAAEIREWFMKRSPGWGFECIDACVDNFRADIIECPRKPENVILNKAVVRGALKVTDRDLFTKSALRGIGRGKAFGCGFLQIVPSE